MTERIHGTIGVDQMNGLMVKLVGHDVCTHNPTIYNSTNCDRLLEF